MIPVFERTKTIRALDRAATVIGTQYIEVYDLFCKYPVQIQEETLSTVT
jgi:hypothetical protein